MSRFCGKAILILSNTKLEKFLNNFHLLKVFSVILALSKISGIFLSSILLNMYGHISESINIAALGFHILKICLQIKSDQLDKIDG